MDDGLTFPRKGLHCHPVADCWKITRTERFVPEFAGYFRGQLAVGRVNAVAAAMLDRDTRRFQASLGKRLQAVLEELIPAKLAQFHCALRIHCGWYWPSVENRVRYRQGWLPVHHRTIIDVIGLTVAPIVIDLVGESSLIQLDA